MGKYEAAVEKKKLDLKIWAKKENIAKYIAYGIIAGMVATVLLVTYFANR